MARALRPLGGSFRLARSTPRCRASGLLPSVSKIGASRFYRPSASRERLPGSLQENLTAYVNMLHTPAALVSFEKELQEAVRRRSQILALRQKYNVPEGVDISVGELPSDEHIGKTFHIKKGDATVAQGYVLFEDMDGTAFNQQTLVFAFGEPQTSQDQQAPPSVKTSTSTFTWMAPHGHTELEFPIHPVGHCDEAGLVNLAQQLGMDGKIDDLMGYFLEQFMAVSETTTVFSKIQFLRSLQPNGQNWYRLFRWNVPNPDVPQNLESDPHDVAETASIK